MLNCLPDLPYRPITTTNHLHSPTLNPHLVPALQERLHPTLKRSMVLWPHLHGARSEVRRWSSACTDDIGTQLSSLGDPDSDHCCILLDGNASSILGTLAFFTLTLLIKARGALYYEGYPLMSALETASTIAILELWESRGAGNLRTLIRWGTGSIGNFVRLRSFLHYGNCVIWGL